MPYLRHFNRFYHLLCIFLQEYVIYCWTFLPICGKISYRNIGVESMKGPDGFLIKYIKELISVRTAGLRFNVPNVVPLPCPAIKKDLELGKRLSALL